MITEAMVERFNAGAWRLMQVSCIGGNNLGPMPKSLSIPDAILEGRAVRRFEICATIRGVTEDTAPVRVVDTSGAVVAQWGTP